MKKLEMIPRRLSTPGRHATHCLLMAVLTAANARAQDLDNVRTGIQDRVKQFSTVDVTWSVISRFEVAGNQAVNVRDPFGAEALSKESGRGLPATVQWQARMRSDKKSLRLDYARPRWNGGESRFNSQPQILAFDGNVVRFLMTNPAYPFPHRGKELEPPKGGGSSVAWSPLLLQFRGFVYPAIDDEDFFGADVVAAKDVLAGRPMEVLTATHKFANFTRKVTIWVDPQRDYAVCQATRSQNGQKDCSFTVELWQTVDGIDLPGQWISKEFGVQGQLDVTSRGQVVKVEFNRPIAETVINPPFPRGTLLDGQGDKEGQWIVVGNDQREFVVTLQQLRGLDSPESGEKLLQSLEK